MPKLLSNDSFRERVTAKVRDPVVRAFWREEYAAYERRFRLEAIAPLQNKVGRLLGNAPMRNIMGQTRTRFDARFLMDHGRIMVADLAKGGDRRRSLSPFKGAPFLAVPVGGNAACRFAGFLPYPSTSTSTNSRALRQRPLPPSSPKRGSTAWHSSSSTNTSTSSRTKSAKRIRQYRVGQSDARIFENELGGDVKVGNLVSLGSTRSYARLLDQGCMREPFRGRTLPPIQGTVSGRRQAVIRRSRERYGRPREEVEAKIHRWLGG